MLESKDFLKLYDDVFDETGKVKAVGREHTKNFNRGLRAIFSGY